MKQTLFYCFAIFFLFSCQNTNQELVEKTNVDLTQFVNPFIGTGGHGHTYPGATVPFGMVQLSPDTRLEGWDGCSGYHYTDSIVYGFSHTHLSGTGVSDYGDILLMPTTGNIIFNNGYDGKEGYSSPFLKEKETAEPGYYAMQLEKYNIQVELTATERVGVHRYTFPTSEMANVILDLDHRDMFLDTGFKVENDHTISGFRISDAWAREQHVYFYAQFSRPFTTVKEDTLNGQRNYALNFEPHDEPLVVKVGISPVDIEGARKNLEGEVKDFDFDEVRSQAKEKWNDQLNKIVVSHTDTNHMVNFYSALYHTSIVPNVFMDVDGRYRGMDMQIGQTDAYDRYTVFSLWDTYRATHPLYTIIEQERTNDFINTFLAQYEEGGKLPMWELACNYTYCMIGYHAVPVIADAYVKGITGYDADKALEAMVAAADADDRGKPYYRELGYLPAEKEHESVSKTLEYAYDDWTIAQMAKAMKQDEVYTDFIGRAQSYKNVMDPETKLMRGKNNNRWWFPFTPEEVNFNYTEANAWQYSFMVPQDISGMADLYGGRAVLEQKLDEMFSLSTETYGRDLKDISGLIGQYAHGNEPSHHMAYLYNYLGKPWKTQEKVNQILTSLYFNAPEGLSGNEDCGQMSAWYVLSSMGIYPMAPGNKDYCLTSPLFDEANVYLENGKSFKVKASNRSDKNIYIQSVRLNGKVYTKSYITHDALMKGGELEFVLGPQPNESWGIGKENEPVTQIDENLIMPVPGLVKGNRSFYVKDTVVMNNIMENAKIFFTTDGSDIAITEEGEMEGTTQLYDGPIEIDNSLSIKAVAWNKELGASRQIEATFLKLPQNRSINIKDAYASYYAAGGDNALIDYILGEPDFRTGEWQGYYGVDLDAVVDLGSPTALSSIKISFIQDVNSWIFMPTKVVFETSKDGRIFTKLDEIITQTDPKEWDSIVE
ncbi:MAG: GH92 family glycosyl hydrolase, partial [Bacteroidota bacterium]